jgi:hypothetical protein
MPDLSRIRVTGPLEPYVPGFVADDRWRRSGDAQRPGRHLTPQHHHHEKTRHRARVEPSADDS